MNNPTGIGRGQAVFLVLLRIFIGWHLLYEGIAKLLIPDWSSEAYLLNSKWIFGGIFNALAQNPSALQVVDFLNIWGLILLGLALLLGILSRYAAIGGMVLLSLYYVANPPFFGIDFGMPAEGHYLFINKTLIEIIALGFLAVFPSGSYFGLDRFLKRTQASKSGSVEGNTSGDRPVPDNASSAGNAVTVDARKLERRAALRYMAMAPILGTFAWGSARKYKWNSVNATTGATIKVPDINLKDLKAPVLMGQIEGKKVSRVLAGGNLIGGWSHSRDLRYVNRLFKAYNTEKKVFETLQLVERAGINTINIGFISLELLSKYKRIFGSELQVMVQVHPKPKNLYGDIDKAMEHGCEFIQIQGNCTDWRVRDGEIDVLVNAMNYIRENGFTAGLGAHSVQALVACEEAGIKPDFFMKTLHHDNYWSAHPKENRIPFSVDGERSLNHDEFHDNMFCLFPEETIEFMARNKTPWIAFKVLAGGAIKPEDGFSYAFENGADFICVGMFDWQVVEDVNIANDVLSGLKGRTRDWYG